MAAVPFYRKNGIVLWNEDCIAGMREHIRSGTVDTVVTSPPYNIGVPYSTYRDMLPKKEYLRWIVKVCVEIRRVLKENGSFFLNVGGTPSDPWLPMEIAGRLRRHFVLQNMIHWVKSISVPVRNGTGESYLSLGHYKPVGGKRYLNSCHEFIFHFTKNGTTELDRLAIGVPYGDRSNIGRWKSASAGKRCRGNVWFIPYRTIQSRSAQRPHPSTFPKELAEMCILLHGNPEGQVILDPFMGAGSTAMAALMLRARCVGFEIDQAYLSWACRRLDEAIDEMDI